uniref:Uncharacterized protein MANES_01G215600 n=1 Tax=Rhizophora mucronata TaxID=61149 RepID=A0A2P2NUV9_RHIMU
MVQHLTSAHFQSGVHHLQLFQHILEMLTACEFSYCSIFPLTCQFHVCSFQPH